MSDLSRPHKAKAPTTSQSCAFADLIDANWQFFASVVNKAVPDPWVDRDLARPSLALPQAVTLLPAEPLPKFQGS
jgi:hypothetical protein